MVLWVGGTSFPAVAHMHAHLSTGSKLCGLPDTGITHPVSESQLCHDFSMQVHAAQKLPVDLRERLASTLREHLTGGDRPGWRRVEWGWAVRAFGCGPKVGQVHLCTSVVLTDRLTAQNPAALSWLIVCSLEGPL